MNIPFNEIPANLRVPGVYIEFDASLAGNPQLAHKVLVMGQRTTAGTVAAGVPTRAMNGNQAEEFFGRGSQLAAMITAARNAKPYLDVWGLALDDAVAGVAATGKVTVTGTATAAGTLALYIGAVRVRVAIAVGDTASAVATDIVAAITANTALPVTAAVNGVNNYEVDITCRWKGETGNDIDLRANFYTGEKTPAGITLAFTAMASGSGNPDVATAVTALGLEWWNWFVLPYTDAANMTAFETELAARFGPMVQKGARAFTAYRGTVANTTTFGNGRNSAHVTCMGTGSSPTPPWIWAAVNAAVDGEALAIDPARPVRSLVLTGVLGPALQDQFTDEEQNTLLWDGISTYTVDTDGTVRVSRQITMYQENSAGIDDDAFLEINTPETLERFRYAQRAHFASRFPRHKLADDGDELPSEQPIMTPTLAMSELLAVYRQCMARGWVTDYDGYAESLRAGIDPDNPVRLNVQDSPKLVGQYLIHAQQTQFRR